MKSPLIENVQIPGLKCTTNHPNLSTLVLAQNITLKAELSVYIPRSCADYKKNEKDMFLRLAIQRETQNKDHIMYNISIKEVIMLLCYYVTHIYYFTIKPTTKT